MCREFVIWVKSFRPRKWDKLDQATVMVPPQVFILKNAETLYVATTTAFMFVSSMASTVKLQIQHKFRCS